MRLAYACTPNHRPGADHQFSGNGTVAYWLVEENERMGKDSIDIDAIVMNIFPDLTVRHGVFRGLKYPERKSIGSALFPKLLGSYERELQPILQEICHDAYTEIINIGCAEGYYAVGLAMRIPSTRVFAYDTDEEAIRLCKKMAMLNSVDKRVFVGSFCDPNTLRRIPLTKKGLILSDCEGYEKYLFAEALVPYLESHDLLIEIHDFIDPSISSTIRRRFKESHEFEVIRSLDDFEKAQTYFYEELAGFDLATRGVLVGEQRPVIMEWFYMKSRRGGQ